jgi:photosystem II stability/assembly factor-like uncharacterized protein
MKPFSITVAVLAVALAATDASFAQDWVQLTAPSTNIGPIACSADGTKLLVASGDWFDVGDVLYISHDSGATWRAADVPVGAWYAVASSADGTVLMAVLMPGAVYISKDSGATWSPAPLKWGWWQNVACSADGATLYATAFRNTDGPPEGIYASRDGGETWSETGTPPTAYGDWGPVACSADGTRVIAGQGPNVWISTNSGMNLRLACTLDPPYVGPGDRFVCASLACSADGRKVALGARAVSGYSYSQVAVATSADAGATWAWTSATIPTNAPWCSIWRTVCISADGHRLAAMGGGLHPASGLPLGPVLVSENFGGSWYEPPGVAERPFYPGGVAPDTTNSMAPWTGLAMSADGSKLTGVFLIGLVPSFDPGLMVHQSVPAPVIDIGVTAGQVVLSWVVPSANFVLQQSPEIGATNWIDVPGTPVLNYSTLREEAIVSGSGSRMFYRLVLRP